MGWWTTTIYGGDIPLSWREKIYQICEVNEYGLGSSTEEIAVEVLNDKIDNIISVIESDASDAENMNIAFQVLGAICIRSGFDFSSVNGLKDKIITASEEDSYAKEDKIRKNVIDNFISTIRNYDPLNPVNIEEYNMEKEPDIEHIEKEFRQIFGLISARKQKLKRGLDEKTGIKEYDEGFADASKEEISFLDDFKELLEKLEMFGVIIHNLENEELENSKKSESYATSDSVGNTNN